MDTYEPTPPQLEVVDTTDPDAETVVASWGATLAADRQSFTFTDPTFGEQTGDIPGGWKLARVVATGTITAITQEDIDAGWTPV